MLDWFPNGRHRFCEDGEIIRWELHGPLDPEECREVLAFSANAAKTRGYGLRLIDSRDAGPVPAETRRFLAEWGSSHTPHVSTALFGASTLMRLVGTLLVRGIRLVNSRVAPTEFFATESEARAWLAAEKARWQKLKTSSG